jgi:homoserine O-acetyltransferase
VGERHFVDVGSVTTESGVEIPNVRVAYETWGTLNADRTNAIYICHALTGDSHVTGPAGPGHATAGWWEGLVGPGCDIDTDEWFVVCANVLGGCQGTTGPSSLAEDGRPWGSRFPVVTVADMVEVERRLSDALGIDTRSARSKPIRASRVVTTTDLRMERVRIRGWAWLDALLT